MKIKLKLPPGIRDMHLLIPMAKRRGISIEHSSRDLSSSSEPVESSSREIEGKLSRPVSAESRPIEGKIKEIEVDDPDKPSTDLRWHPKGILLWIIRLPGTIKRNWEIFYPPKTEAEQKEKQDLETLKSRTTTQICTSDIQRPWAAREKRIDFCPGPRCSKKVETSQI
jgi:hypothetical protein